MSWLYSRVLVEAYWAGNYSDGEPSAQSKTTPMPQAYLWPDKTTGAWNRFPSGMMCEPLTDKTGAAVLTWYQAAFPAKTSAQPDAAPESKVSDPGCGWKWPGSWGKYDPDTSLWKTRQCSLLGDLELFSETWPRWGTMRDGEFWGQSTPERHTDGNESGLSEEMWPTPRTQMTRPVQVRGDVEKGHKNNLEEVVAVRQMWPTPRAGESSTNSFGKPTLRGLHNHGTGGQLNPTWVEWLMGWPLGWTDLEPLAMDKYQQWQRSHGVCLLENKE